jgi:hypothetical protein
MALELRLTLAPGRPDLAGPSAALEPRLGASPEVAKHWLSAGRAPLQAKVIEVLAIERALRIDALAALPALLRAAGFHEAAAFAQQQIDTSPGRDEQHAYIEAARELYFNEGDDHRTEIDGNAIVSASEDGAYVMAWRWVYRGDARGRRHSAESLLKLGGMWPNETFASLGTPPRRSRRRFGR